MDSDHVNGASMIGVPPPAIASEGSHAGKVTTQAIIGTMVKRIKFFSIFDMKEWAITNSVFHNSP